MTLRHSLSRISMPFATTAIAVALLTACQQASPPPARRVLRLTTGAPGARFLPLGQALADAYAAAFPDFDVRVQESEGSVSNVEALQSDHADVGLAYADVAYMAYVGQLGERRQPFTDLRGLAVIELAPVHLVVGAHSAIRDPAGLRGQRVAVGPIGSGSALTAQIVLKALGLDAQAVRVQSLGYNDAAARLADGTIDALFVTGTDPVDSVGASTGGGARLLPLVGRAIDKLRHDFPFFRPTVIPGGTYRAHPQAVHTIGVDNLLVCRRGLDEAAAHDLTKAFFSALPLLPMSNLMDLEQAPATPIPLHEGAARYYRERELAR
jgi:hypothetical protein